MSRRSMLGLAVALPVVGGCARAWEPAPGPPPEIPVLVRTRWRDRPDGPIPATGDEGVPLQVSAPHGTPPTVAGGALVGNLPDESAATYVMQPLVNKVRRIGAEFGFEPGTSGGSMTLVAWVPYAQPTTHIHVAFAPDRWIAATAQDAKLDEIGSASYAEPLVQDGRPYRAEVVVDGAMTYLTLPDGSVVAAEDEGVARIGGSAPCWQFFRQEPGSAGVRFYETWAG